MTLAKLISSAREKRGLSLRKLAQKCDISFQHVHYMEQGKSENIEVKTIKALAKALDISPVAIFRACL